MVEQPGAEPGNAGKHPAAQSVAEQLAAQKEQRRPRATQTTGDADHGTGTAGRGVGQPFSRYSARSSSTRAATEAASAG